MKYKVLMEQARAALDQAQGLVTDGELTDETKGEFDKLMAQAESLQERAVKLRAVEDRDAQLQATMGAAAQKETAATEDKAFGPLYTLRFGDESKAQEHVLTGLVGPDYRQQIADQNVAFAKYLRWGDRALERAEWQSLQKQIFPWTQVEYLLKNGMTLAQIKSTMVEAQGTLGGYAVPPNVQAGIVSRLPGLTAVRGGGARVVELTAGNAVDVPVYTGGTNAYRGAIRGAWGSETQTPAEKNATLGMTPVVAHVYTYKVSMSQSLVEDAANLVDLVQSDIGDTLAIDEDVAFLVGDGNGKPMGILPNSANELGLSHVHSGSGTALLAAGIRSLKRAVGSQYRARGVWIGNSATFGLVEGLIDGEGNVIFGDLSETGKLLNANIRESEAMPDVAGSAFPLLFADLSGYWIVQKAGLTIVRMQDSNTGINKVEYHVRRRVGGRVVDTWKFAVQEVAA